MTLIPGLGEWSVVVDTINLSTLTQLTCPCGTYYVNNAEEPKLMFPKYKFTDNGRVGWLVEEEVLDVVASLLLPSTAAVSSLSLAAFPVTLFASFIHSWNRGGGCFFRGSLQRGSFSHSVLFATVGGGNSGYSLNRPLFDTV